MIMSDFNLDDIFQNAMSAIVNDFCFAIPVRELCAFLDHYGFDGYMSKRALLVSLCAMPVDVYCFSFAVYMLSGPDCKLQTQKEIADALIAYKRNNFTL